MWDRLDMEVEPLLQEFELIEQHLITELIVRYADDLIDVATLIGSEKTKKVMEVLRRVGEIAIDIHARAEKEGYVNRLGQEVPPVRRPEVPEAERNQGNGH